MAAHPLSDARVLGQLEHLGLVLVRELVRGEEVLLLVDVVGLDQRREHGEAVLGVERGVEVVGVDARHLLQKEAKRSRRQRTLETRIWCDFWGFTLRRLCSNQPFRDRFARFHLCPAFTGLRDLLSA